MLETVFRTRDVPVGERFDAWRELMAKTLCPMSMSSDLAARFEAEMDLLRLGGVSVWPGAAQAMSFRRTPKMIRQSDPESYHLTFLLEGTLGISQDGRQSLHGPGEMYIIDTSRPFDCFNSRARLIGVEIPRKLVPLPEHKVGRLTTRRLPARRGPGGLFTRALDQLVRDVDSFGPADAPRLEAVLADLLAATLAHELDAGDRLPGQTRGHTLALRVQSFLQRHLRDPDLTPAAVAAAHHISIGHLHRVFRGLGHGTTLAAWVRDQRLDHARRELADPVRRTVPIHHVAARWGFTDPAVFSRAFRTRYGISPRDYRHRAAEEPAPRPPGGGG